MKRHQVAAIIGFLSANAPVLLVFGKGHDALEVLGFLENGLVYPQEFVTALTIISFSLLLMFYSKYGSIPTLLGTAILLIGIQVHPGNYEIGLGSYIIGLSGFLGLSEFLEDSRYRF